MNPTLEDLEREYAQLEQEVQKIKAIIDASDTSTFEIFIEQIKEEMIDNVKEEDFKTLKQNKLKVEKFREIIKIIQNQTKLLEQKTAEMKDLQWKIEHFQQSLPLEIPEQAVETGFSLEINDNETHDIKTGDVFKFKDLNDEFATFYLVKKSAEMEGSFAIISHALEGERCLQYPSNFKLIEKAKYIGNIYDENADEEVVEALSLIAGSQEAEATAE